MMLFFKKLHNSPVVMQIFYFCTLIIYWICFDFFCKSLLSLEGIETTIRYIILACTAIFGILYTIFGMRKMMNRKTLGFVFLTIFALLFSMIYGLGSYYINRIYDKIEQFTTSDTSTYTTVILTLKDTTFTNESKIGMVTDELDRTSYILPTEWINKEKMPNEIEFYSNPLELIEALYNREVDAIFVSKDYAVIYGSDDRYQNIGTETKIEAEYSKEMKTEESELLASTKSLTEPFTMLILGVDSEATTGLDANAAFNGDTLLLVTFNPKTLSATMLSIPRDMYVPIISANGQSRWYGKINSSAALGTASTINTIENITGIDIDYFVKVNFRGVIDLVNAVGGIDVDVEQPDYSYYVSVYGEGRLCESNSLRDMTNLVCMNTGMQHLDGEQALAYARNRHGFLESDIARNRHQQQIIEALAKKIIKTSSLSDFEKLLDTISNNIASNMKTSQILSFYQSIKGMLMNALSGEEFINIQKTQLTYYDLNINGISCLGYYEGSMNAITTAMKENLGLIKIEDIKTFYYDYSEDYDKSSDIIGKGIYTGQRLQVMPSFIGRSVSEAQSFANRNNLHMTIEYRDNPNEIAGIILDQSIATGTLTNQFSSFTIYVNNPTVKPKEEEKEKEEENKKPTTNTETNKNENKNENNENQEKPKDDEKEKEEAIIPGTPTKEENKTNR